MTKVNSLNDLINKINIQILEKTSYYLSIFLFIIPILIFFINFILPSETKTIWLTLVLLLGLFSFVNAFLYNYKDYKQFGRKHIFNLLKENKYIIFLLFYMICSFISCLFSSNKTVSFFGSDYHSEGFVCYLSYFGLFMNSLIIVKKEYFNKIINVFIFSVTFISIVTLCNYYFDNLNFHFTRKFTSIFMNENHYAYYLTMGLVCNLCSLLFFKMNKKITILYFIFYLINCHTLILNNTLGCYLTFITIICLTFLYLLISKKPKIKLLICGFIFIIISLLNLNIVSTNLKSLSGDFTSIKETITEKKEISGIYNVGTNRMGLWVNGLKFMLAKPLFGYGVDNLLEQYVKINNIEQTSRPHNEYIQIGASIGIPGLIFYLLFLLTLFYKSLKNMQQQFNFRIISILVALSYLISAFFGVSVFYTTPYLYIFLGLSVPYRLLDKK